VILQYSFDYEHHARKSKELLYDFTEKLLVFYQRETCVWVPCVELTQIKTGNLHARKLDPTVLN